MLLLSQLPQCNADIDDDLKVLGIPRLSQLPTIPDKIQRAIQYADAHGVDAEYDSTTDTLWVYSPASSRMAYHTVVDRIERYNESSNSHSRLRSVLGY